MNADLKYLAQTYFHQDWDLEAESPEGVLDLFIRSEPQAAVTELVADIEATMASSATDDELRNRWLMVWKSGYHPDAARPMREFLEATKRRLVAGAKAH